MQSRCCSERSKYDTDANLLKGSKTDDIALYGAAFASDGLTNNNLDYNFLSGGSKGLQRWQWVQVDTTSRIPQLSDIGKPQIWLFFRVQFSKQASGIAFFL